MARNVKLLLTETVDSLGIVGDVVNVRVGYARNFLLPRDLATQPSEEKIKALATKRADEEKKLAELRKQREMIIGKLEGVEVQLTRSCNDQGILYGAVTQQDIATALSAMGYTVKPREVRLSQVIKRVDNYDVHVKLDSDLDATVKLTVVADRKLEAERTDAEKPAHSDAEKAKAEAAPEGSEAPEAQKAESDDRPARKPREKREYKKDAPKTESKKEEAPQNVAVAGKFGGVPTPGPEMFMAKPRRSKRD
jgi:large subunit ribosomal protein L9